jgi:hypothetical protein
MSDLLLQVGVGGIFTILVLKEVFGFLYRYKGSNNKANIEQRIGGVHERMWKLDKLYDWHNTQDEDGVPVWYVRKSLEEAIKELSSLINTLHESKNFDVKELRAGQIEIQQYLKSLHQQLKPPA